MNPESSDKRAEANRLNAQKSTGPRTLEGKQAVRLNALKHGLSARTVVLPGEDAAEFQQLCDNLEAAWQPQDRTERYLLEKMAISEWQQARGQRREFQILSQPERYSTEKHNELIMLRDIRQRLERTWSKSLAELRSLRKERRLEQERAAKLEREAAKPEKQSQPEEPAPAESAKQSHSHRSPAPPNPADYLNTRDILRQVELEKAQKLAKEQSPPPLDRQ